MSPWKKIIAAAGITASLAIPAATIAASAAPAVAASAQHASSRTFYHDLGPDLG